MAEWTTDTEQAVVAFLGSWSVMCASSRGGSWTEHAGVVRGRTGLPVPPFNGVWSTRQHVAAGDVLAAVDEFEAGDLPWNVQLRPGYPVEIDGELARRGLVVTGDIPFMILPDPSGLAAALVGSPATYRQVESFADLDSMLSLLERGFGMPSRLAREMFPMRLMFLASTWIATDGPDVSTGLGFVRDGWCGVFNVATPEEQRGRGYGAAVTAHAVEQARTAGARGAYLQSSPMGLPVYERLGFVTVETWRQWMPAQYAG
ncbi:MAG: GNAT family N-acetyltransferase [Sporichthyaceae bacterium]